MASLAADVPIQEESCNPELHLEAISPMQRHLSLFVTICQLLAYHRNLLVGKALRGGEVGY